MESAKRMKPVNDDEEERSLSAFHFPDLTIKVGNEKLYVNRDQLMAESPVFRTMLTGNFKEKNAREIELPDKDTTTFALFLRHTLPGFDGLILSARRILPLTHEYQTQISLEKIDKALASYTGAKESDKLIDDILEAEFFSLPRYLTACIQKANLLSPTVLERNPKFDNITSDTKSRIFIMKCKAMESETDKCMMVLEKYVSFLGCKSVDCAHKQKVEEAKTILRQNVFKRDSKC
ncbi:Hypothetical predicted protein [Mytilus galloprovincialis]|uniref:BTB domain-containing protein n=1 Tax=Mytilus galloprovincialis TaxID=29158 RepID=A0A8B6DXA9_MYTGA|nr:Hypothetical predicted protein [Mytilus galloprovincialis]